MPGECCQRPRTKIIKVGTFEAGIIDFDAIMKEQAGTDLPDDQELGIQLVSKARKHGNYISPASEELYRVALSREFRIFVHEVEKPR